MKKHIFTYAEKYAVWHYHGKRCWFCVEPLRLEDTTIDHLIPENLIENKKRLLEVFGEFGLPESFMINGFENWLPCHSHCNQSKGSEPLRHTSVIQLIIDRLVVSAPYVKKIAEKVTSDSNKDKVFGILFSALEEKIISTQDLKEIMGRFSEEPTPFNVQDDVILLDGGYWVCRNDIVSEGICQCERDHCVEHKEKVYCYFRPGLSQWVIKSGLYWKCYDEIVKCPRCLLSHKRGHIGKQSFCGNPFSNQESKSDFI